MKKEMSSKIFKNKLFCMYLVDFQIIILRASRNTSIKTVRRSLSQSLMFFALQVLFAILNRQFKQGCNKQFIKF